MHCRIARTSTTVVGHQRLLHAFIFKRTRTYPINYRHSNIEIMVLLLFQLFNFGLKKALSLVNQKNIQGRANQEKWWWKMWSTMVHTSNGGFCGRKHLLSVYVWQTPMFVKDAVQRPLWSQVTFRPNQHWKETFCPDMVCDFIEMQNNFISRKQQCN